MRISVGLCEKTRNSRSCVSHQVGVSLNRASVSSEYGTWSLVCVAGSMLSAAASRRLRSCRKHSSSHFSSGREGSGFALLARQRTSCLRMPQGHAVSVLPEHAEDSLHGVWPWQPLWQRCSQNIFTLPQVWPQAPPSRVASSQSPGRWHSFLQKCKPHFSFLPQGLPQRASCKWQGWLCSFSLPQEHHLSTRNGHLGHPASSG